MNLDEHAVSHSVNHSHVDPQQGKERQHHAKNVTNRDDSKVYCHRCHAIQQDDITVIPRMHDKMLLLENMFSLATSLPVAQWLENPTGVRNVIGSLPVGDSVFFFASRS